MRGLCVGKYVGILMAYFRVLPEHLAGGIEREYETV
jgi:hypothetical protein